ncbi:hypothetical protein KSP40_PGU019922 [Platanthera guangdongensis]|uniref:Uncharacterized protein n=1 Tax=Platanthera guangdongensis TaxID=2320717 RepID=A0ABR2LGW5_9ASPA
MSLLSSSALISPSLPHLPPPFYFENPNSPFLFSNLKNPLRWGKLSISISASAAPPNSDRNPSSNPSQTPRKRGRPPKPKDPPESAGLRDEFPTMIPEIPGAVARARRLRWRTTCGRSWSRCSSPLESRMPSCLWGKEKC